MKLTKTLAILLLSFAATTPLTASHIAGADLTYQHLNGDTFLFKLQLYRDCNGAPVGNLASVTGYSLSCQLMASTTLYLVDSAEIAPLCPSMQSNTSCHNGNLPGIQVYRFQDTLVLPGHCDDWVFFYHLCCRNTTVNSVGQEPMLVEAHLDNLNFPDNSSPLFVETPVSFVCVNNDFCINDAALDIDGDSLVYSFTPPLQDTNTSITWANSYSYNQPINGALIDTNTGNVCFLPTSLGNFNMAVKVEEYSGGNLKGSVMRDMEVIVINCSVPTNTFLGQVTDTNGNPVSASTVELYKYNINPSMTLVANTAVDANGNFAFPNMPFAQYVIQAHPDTNLYPGHVPTYHDSAYAWKFANIEYSLCDTVMADIKLKGIGNLNELNWISGTFANSPFGPPMQTFIADIDMFLLQQSTGEIVAWTRTNANGHYLFNHLPDGDYQIYADIPGALMDSTYYITLNSSNPGVDGRNFWTDSVWIYIDPSSTGMAHKHPELTILQVYPNPSVNGVVNIGMHLGAATDIGIEILDVTGNVVYAEHQRAVQEGFHKQLPVEALGKGIYIIRVETGAGVYCRKMILH